MRVCFVCDLLCCSMVYLLCVFVCMCVFVCACVSNVLVLFGLHWGVICSVCLFMCLCGVFVIYCEMLYGVWYVFCVSACAFMCLCFCLCDGVMLNGSFLACVFLLCLCVRVCACCV